MSLPPAQALAALAMTQLQTVAPALEGSYAGGSAGTIGLLTLLLAQDAVTAEPRRARECAAMRALLAAHGEAADGDHAALLARIEALHARVESDPAANRAILALLADMADAAFVAPPPMA
jgi:hypothetical protein